MSGKAVRQHYMREFKGLDGHSRSRATLIVFGYLSQVIMAAALGYWIVQYPVDVWSVVAIVLIIFFIGTRLRGFNNIVHECSHFAFTRDRASNIFFGRLCASLVLSCYKDYREEHMTHHAHLGDYERDMDLHGIQDLRIEDPLTPRTILRHLVSPLVGLHLPYYLGANLSNRDGTPFLLLKYGLIVAAVAAMAADPLAATLFVWVPFVWVYSAINYWTDCIDHGGLIESEDDLESSRNVAVPRALRWLLFPRNDSFHLVHHLFPNVPA
ncbi:MAG: fatty acid desaturase, partial [Pseudomonadota bacterium]